MKKISYAFLQIEKNISTILGEANAGQDSALLNTKDICQKMSDQSTLEDIFEEIFDIFDRDY